MLNLYTIKKIYKLLYTNRCTSLLTPNNVVNKLALQF